VVEQYLPDHNESISVVLDRFSAIGVETPGLVALLGTYMPMYIRYYIHMHT
jgi:peroxidase